MRMSHQQLSGKTFKSNSVYFQLLVYTVESPSLSYCLIANATSDFKAAVHRSLKAGVNCNNRSRV